MCVRTIDEAPPDEAPPIFREVRCPFQEKLFGSSSTRTTTTTPASTPTKSSLTKAKEKYMKLHDEMLVRESKQREADEARVENEDATVGGAGDDEEAWSRTSARQGRKIARKLRERLHRFQDSKLYKILFCTAQPAHVITIAAVLCVTSALLPTAGTTPERTSAPAGQPRSRLTSFVYLASFVMHFGSQFWMTFVSGLSLYFALPRHTFGEVQRVLFPRYFTLNACLSLTTLLIYVKHHPAHSWDAEIAIQVISMGGTFFLELLIRLYLTPPLLRLIDLKTSLERAAGVGAEIGRHDPGPLKHCPHYLKIHAAFRRIHMTIAMGNMLTMACTVLHLYYIASKICVL